ncbi:hypothetical protein PCURB6_18610 [Paenibacillus curdlanolyticus]|nr:hypothetical protein [Paenibacillus curdlanolyticus]GFN31601.1 hypothetical protein PCURB6_18610 [Paenibacillus curdlanolyticus]
MCLLLIQGVAYVHADQPVSEQIDASESGSIKLGVVDERQDIRERRTPNSKSYLTSIPGQYKEVIYSTDIHYIGSDQQYYEINTAVTDENAISQIDKPVSREIQEEFQKAKDKRKAADKAKKKDFGRRVILLRTSGTLQARYPQKLL